MLNLLRHLTLATLISTSAQAASWQQRPPPATVPVILQKWQATAPELVTKLRNYAIAQSADSPADIDTLTAHELVHVEQAQDAGWRLPSGQLIPQPQHWPASTQLKHLPPTIAASTPAIYDNYIRRHPTHTPGDLLNEIHAYAITLSYICKRDPAAADAHHTPQLQQFLFTLHALTPATAPLTPQQRQAINTLTTLAKQALNHCKTTP